MVIAHHIILTAYGHWLPNDPRGSRSSFVSAGKLDKLGRRHSGRKRIQPSRSDLREFYRHAPSQLEHPILWFENVHRQAMTQAFESVIRTQRYTCFGCAIVSNHAHLVIRKHRDHAETMINHLRRESREVHLKSGFGASDHPVWSTDSFKKFLFTGDDVRRTVRYIRENPAKSGLPIQDYSFVTMYEGEWDRPNPTHATGRSH